jgi:hypothetical protein
MVYLPREQTNPNHRPGSDNKAISNEKDELVEEASQELTAKSQLPRAKSRSYCFAAVPSIPREAVVLGVAAGDALGGPFSNSAE